MLPYRLLAAATTFLSAFLLFQVQPIIARQILPWFGGSAAVWTTCLLFFQCVLFFGYVYAHWITHRLRPRQQATLHTTLLILSLLALPAIPATTWKTTAGGEPITRILGLLAVTVGLPYAILSATSPLVQSWLSRAPGQSLPYRFYALSNVASLLALLAYPVGIEPWLPVRAQALWWSVLYAVFALCCAQCAWYAPSLAGTAAGLPVEAGGGDAPRPPAAAPLRTRARWVTLAAIPTTLSLAVTNHLCQNVAPIPFLWIVPLGIYLLTLILCFDGDGWYRRGLFLPAYLAASAGAAWLLVHESPDNSVRLLIPFFAGLLFLACMYFHGELARRKPAAAQLTSFYLMMSLGGAIGALLVAIGAPLWLAGDYELVIALALAALALLMLEYRKHWALDAVCAAAAIALFVAASATIGAKRASARLSERNFYGSLRIVDSGGQRAMVHGVVSHGVQLLDPRLRHELTAYYARGSGVERAVELLRKPGMRVGIIGLGVGNLAALAAPGDHYHFYELNPRVAALARSEFSFLSDCRGLVEITIGDGRLALEQQPPQRFDLLVIDAFSGDSIPFHLLSLEAIRQYHRHLAPGGVIAFHVSNSVLNLVPVARRLALAMGLAPLHIHATADAALHRAESDWVLAGLPARWANAPALSALGVAPGTDAPAPVWTDDYSNLFQVLK